MRCDADAAQSNIRVPAAIVRSDAENVLYSLWHSAKFNQPVTKFERVCFVRHSTKKDGQYVKVERDPFVVMPDIPLDDAINKSID